MNVRSIEAAVVMTIAIRMMLDVHNIKPESKLVEDLDLDSLDRVELCMSLEDEFAIQIPDEEAEKASTVQDVINLVGQLVAAKTCSPKVSP